MTAQVAAALIHTVRLSSRLLAVVVLSSVARAEIEFSGVLATSEQTRFALTDTSTSRTDWVGLKGTFAGFVVSSYDKPAETLTLTRGGTSIRVHLKDDAKVKAARLELTGTITYGGGEKVEIERATLVFDQENVFPLKDGITYRVTPARRPDGTNRYSISIEQRMADNRIDRLAAPTVITLPNQTFSIRLGEFGFTFTPKSP